MATVVKLGGGAIPTLRIAPAGAPPTVGLLLQHGFGADKYDLEEVGETLATAGVTVWLPDAPGHGERFDPTGPHPAYDYTADDFLRLVRQTRDDLIALHAELRAQGLARVWFAGFSLGGMAAILATEAEPAAAGLIAFAGGATPDLWERPLDLGAPSAAPLAWARDMDMGAPRNATRLAPRPVLLLHGRDDAVVPPAGSRRLYDAAAPAYASQPERLRLSWDDAPHAITPALLREALAWLERYREVTRER